MKKKKVYVLSPSRKTRIIPIVFTGIVAFLIVFPFIAVNLRFQTGYLFGKVFNFIGALCLMGGGFFTMYSLLSVFVGHNSLKLKMLSVGIVLLWIGCWLTGEVLNIFGFSIGEEHTSPGYH